MADVSENKENKSDVTGKEAVDMNVASESEGVDLSEETIESSTDESADNETGNIDPKDQRITELEEALKEEENKVFRALADFENFKRRAALDKEAMNKYKAQSILTGLLPVLENFERALAVEVKSDDAKSLLTGMDMIYRNLLDSLKSEGLVEIEALDKEFDPNFHQAVMTDNEPDKDSNIVLQELQKGYMLKDRVLRPSMVKVNE